VEAPYPRHQTHTTRPMQANRFFLAFCPLSHKRHGERPNTNILYIIHHTAAHVNSNFAVLKGLWKVMRFYLLKAVRTGILTHG